jgi:hypothetical protein
MSNPDPAILGLANANVEKMHYDNELSSLRIRPKVLDFQHYLTPSVADPGCLSRILIFTHPGSRIPEPKIATIGMGEKICCHTFLCSPKFHKIVNNFSFEMQNKKKFEPIF